MRVLVLLTDGFGGHGGIAKFNRDLLTALCAHPACEEVVVLPRLMPEVPGPLPCKLIHITDGLNSKARFIFAALKQALRRPRVDLLVCGHINLLPIAYPAQWLTSAPLLLVIHGVDAWQPTRSWLANRLARK